MFFMPVIRIHIIPFNLTPNKKTAKNPNKPVADLHGTDVK